MIIKVYKKNPIFHLTELSGNAIKAATENCIQLYWETVPYCDWPDVCKYDEANTQSTTGGGKPFVRGSESWSHLINYMGKHYFDSRGNIVCQITAKTKWIMGELFHIQEISHDDIYIETLKDGDGD